MEKKWKFIDGYNRYYAISNYGEIKSYYNGSITMLKQQSTKHGYLYVDLWDRGERERVFIHQQVAKYFVKNPENKPQINHIDGDKQNNRSDNLEWCTPKENIQHAYDNGLVNTVRGERQGS